MRIKQSGKKNLFIISAVFILIVGVTVVAILLTKSDNEPTRELHPDSGFSSVESEDKIIRVSELINVDNNIDEALKLLEEYVLSEDITPFERASAYARIGGLYFTSLSDENKAYEYYDKAIETTPDNPDLYVAKGRVYEWHENEEKAEEYYQTAVDKFDDVEADKYSLQERGYYVDILENGHPAFELLRAPE